jgi:protein SCO1/2
MKNKFGSRSIFAGLIALVVCLLPGAITVAAGQQQQQPASHEHMHHHMPMAIGKPSAEPQTPQVMTKAPTIPDVVLLDQNNQKVHFYSDLIKGKTVAIDFIFTTCTTICPPLTANFARIQKIMQQRGDNDLRLISVTVDPENDTPERLKKYAELFHAQPGWTFVTGSRSDLQQIWNAFNIYLSSSQDHPPTVAVGNDVTHVWNYASGLTSAAKMVAVIDTTMKSKQDGTTAGTTGKKEHGGGAQ